MSGQDLERFDMPSDDTHDPANRLFRIELKQMTMANDIAGIKKTMEDRDKSERENRFTHKDVVGYVFGAIVAAGVLMGGLFYIVTSETNPVNSSLETEKHAITDRFLSLTDSLRQIREQQAKSNEDMLKFFREQATLSYGLELRLQKQEDRK